MDFAFAAATISDAVSDLPTIFEYHRPQWYLAILVLGFFDCAVHELGHFLAARYYGLDAKVRVLAAYRSSDFRRQHGTMGFLSLLAVAIDGLPARPSNQVRIIAAAGPLFEVGFMFAVCCSLFLWLAAHGNHPIGDIGATVDTVVGWVPLQLCVSMLCNVIPIAKAMNDGYAIFCTGRWRDRAHALSK